MDIRSLLSKSIVKNSLWMVVLQTFNMIIPLLTIPYITRILGSAEYGNFSIALNWILYFQVIVEYGFELNGSRRVAVDSSKENIQKILNGIVSSRILLTSISLVLLIVIWFLSDLSVSNLKNMLLLFLMVIGSGISLTWVFQGLQEMKFITIANVIARVISLLLIFLFVKSPEHIHRYCFFYSITFLLSGLIGIIVCYNKYRLTFHFVKLTQVYTELKDGWYLFLSAAMVCIFSNVGVTMLGYFTDDSSVGAYSAIHKLSYVMNVLFLAISKALYPYISASFAISSRVGLLKIRKTMIPVVVFFLLLALGITLLRDSIVCIAFGEEYVPYSFIVIPFVLQVVFGIINNFIGVQSLVGNGHQKSYSSAITIGMVSIVVCNYILIQEYGISGAAYASLVGEMVLTIVLAYRNYKIYRPLYKESKQVNI